MAWFYQLRSLLSQWLVIVIKAATRLYTRISDMDTELIYEVIHHTQGGFSANCLNVNNIDIVAANLEELHDNITAAVDAHFPNGHSPDPSAIHLMLFQD